MFKLNKVTTYIEIYVVVWVVSEAHDLPQEDSVGPYVGLSGVDPIVDGFRGRPL